MYIASTMGTGSLGREIDLDALVSGFEDLDECVESNFSSSSMVTLYIGEDSPAFTVYRTGTFQIRGSESVSDLQEAQELFQNYLNELGIETPDYDFRHVTSVFVDDVGEDLNLEALAIALGLENTEYVPEQFPAIIYKPPEYEVTLLVFSTGKVIVGGTTDRNIAEGATDDLEENVELMRGS